MINRTNTVLAVLLAAVVVMTAAVGVDYSKPNIEILPDMKYTPAWEAFAANPIFPNGQTMQPPVPGTIARGQLPLYFAATKEDAVRAGEELANPHSLRAFAAAVAAERDAAEAKTEAADKAAPISEASSAPEAAQQSEAAVRDVIARERFATSLARGGEVYLMFCISCHGPKGAGDGPVTQRGFPPPPSMLTGKSLQMKDGQLFHILTYGQGSMTRFAAQLSRERRWDVINYVRDLQSNAPPPPEASLPETDTGAVPEPDTASETLAREPEPTIEKSADEKDVKQEKTEEPEAPRNELRDRSSDQSSPASAELAGAKENAKEGTRE